MQPNGYNSLDDLMKDLKELVKEQNEKSILKGIELAFKGFDKYKQQTQNALPPTTELKRKEALQYLGIATSTLYTWIEKGYISKGIIRGNRNYYSISELQQAKKNAERTN